MTKEYFVYILECKDNSYYTGFTINLLERIKKHKSGKGAKYVRAKGFNKLIYFEKFSNENLARKRENEIKKLDRKEKDILVEKKAV